MRAYKEDFAARADSWQDWRVPVLVRHTAESKRVLVQFQHDRHENDIALLMTSSQTLSDKDIAGGSHFLATIIAAMKPEEFRQLPTRPHVVFDEKDDLRADDFGEFFKEFSFPKQH